MILKLKNYGFFSSPKLFLLARASGIERNRGTEEIISGKRKSHSFSVLKSFKEMNYFDNQTVILLAAVAALILGSLYCWQIFYLRDKFKRREEEIKRHLYELTILKE